jgi:exodeoxyribonuclease VII large subunit
VPGLPLRVGLVTADGSAAKADFLHELEQSGVAFRVAFSPSPVQGSGAAARIAAAIRSCELSRVDVIAVVRGGGARTDLAAFDDEEVARAIAGCPIAVFTGIGHEVDTAVADEVAHLALKTPTACAAHLVGLVREAENAAGAVWNRVTVKAADLLSAADAELTRAAFNTRESATSALREADARAVTAARQVRDLTSSQLDRSSHRLAGHLATARLLSRHRLDNADAGIRRVAQRVRRAGRVGIQTANHRVDNAHLQARLLDPERALARGWSITTDANGAVVRSVADAATGSRLTTRLADGTIASTVDAATHQAAKKPSAQTKESS